ncbi:MAG: hypothetical protein O6763_06655 [Gammaproteobacteria bacterium]|jgi:hypothetical protein|nr:hypothetical protein [Gammaproteobacteria bacterium]
MGILRETLLGALLCGAFATTVAADEPEQPGADLLEFLGTWEDDDQWELFVDIVSEGGDTDGQLEVERSANRDVGSDYE